MDCHALCLLLITGRIVFNVAFLSICLSSIFRTINKKIWNIFSCNFSDFFLSTMYCNLCKSPFDFKFLSYGILLNKKWWFSFSYYNWKMLWANYWNICRLFIYINISPLSIFENSWLYVSDLLDSIHKKQGMFKFSDNNSEAP